MGISIYYSADRDRPLSKQETAEVQQIVERYQADFNFRGGEDFCVYEYDEAEPRRIFEGATGLPMGEPENTFEACLHWASCLTEIRRMILDADWHVHMDDYDLTWDEDEGWHFEE